MRVSIERSEISGSIKAEPGKSMAHRLLICAGLADGISRIDNIAESEDILATIGCLRTLGADVKQYGNGAAVRGFDPMNAESAVLQCNESGSTMRFFTPIAALSGRRMTLLGSRTLLSRPMDVYDEVFRSSGARFERGADSLEIEGRLKAGDYEIDGGISSQFITGLLFALPLLDKDSCLRLIPPVESRPYINMSMDALKKFGVSAEWADENTIKIPGMQGYRPADVRVEGDWSNAAFFLAMGVKVDGLDRNSLQGDKVCENLFARLAKGYSEIDISDCPDLGPVLMAYAAMHEGCLLTGTRRLRIKESDRASVMAEELCKFGVDCRVDDNSVEVGCGIRQPEELLLGHNDHRVVMALAVLAAKTGGTIAGAEAVNKSFPAFFDRFAEAGGKFLVE